jgi:hypothetical protein
MQTLDVDAPSPDVQDKLIDLAMAHWQSRSDLDSVTVLDDLMRRLYDPRHPNTHTVSAFGSAL